MQRSTRTEVHQKLSLFFLLSKEMDEIHHAAVANFVGLGLSYKFTVANVSHDSNQPRLRFLFSKPSDSKPEPEIVVWMDLSVLSQNGNVWTYALEFEGQKYRRTIIIDQTNVDKGAFNEKLIDKIFFQKSRVHTTRLWE